MGPPLFLGKIRLFRKSVVGCWLSIMLLRQYMAWGNKRRNRDQGVLINPEVKERANMEEYLVESAG